MGKKAAINRYGVQVGNIFTQNYTTEDHTAYIFYQVIALRGETQVAVRKILKSRVAFDGRHEQVIPIPDAWASDEILIRKVFSGTEGISQAKINIEKGWLHGSASLYHSDREMCLEWSNGHCMPNWLREHNPEIAEQLHLEEGSGVYVADRSQIGMKDGCLVVIRYPDGREEEVILNELLHRETIRRIWGT